LDDGRFLVVTATELLWVMEVDAGGIGTITVNHWPVRPPPYKRGNYEGRGADSVRAVHLGGNRFFAMAYFEDGEPTDSGTPQVGTVRPDGTIEWGVQHPSGGFSPEQSDFSDEFGVKLVAVDTNRVLVIYHNTSYMHDVFGTYQHPLACQGWKRPEMMLPKQRGNQLAAVLGEIAADGTVTFGDVHLVSAFLGSGVTNVGAVKVNKDIFVLWVSDQGTNVAVLRVDPSSPSGISQSSCWRSPSFTQYVSWWAPPNTIGPWPGTSYVLHLSTGLNDFDAYVGVVDGISEDYLYWQTSLTLWNWDTYGPVPPEPDDGSGDTNFDCLGGVNIPVPCISAPTGATGWSVGSIRIR
jgi:hypothetical protein